MITKNEELALIAAIKKNDSFAFTLLVTKLLNKMTEESLIMELEKINTRIKQ